MGPLAFHGEASQHLLGHYYQRRLSPISHSPQSLPRVQPCSAQQPPPSPGERPPRSRDAQHQTPASAGPLHPPRAPSLRRMQSRSTPSYPRSTPSQRRSSSSERPHAGSQRRSSSQRFVLRTIDVKELIAYSSVSHAAVYLLGVFS